MRVILLIDLKFGNTVNTKSEVNITSSGTVGGINKDKKELEAIGDFVNAISTSG